LALARSPEGWWQGTKVEGGVSSVFDPNPVRLIEQPLDEAERTDFFNAARDAFRDALAVAGLATPKTPPPGIAAKPMTGR